MEEEIAKQPKYWLPDKAYTALKWIGLAALPTLSWLYQALAAVWGLPYATEISTTFAIAGTFVAVIIGASALGKSR